MVEQKVAKEGHLQRGFLAVRKPHYRAGIRREEAPGLLEREA